MNQVMVTPISEQIIMYKLRLFPFTFVIPFLQPIIVISQTDRKKTPEYDQNFGFLKMGLVDCRRNDQAPARGDKSKQTQ